MVKGLLVVALVTTLGCSHKSASTTVDAGSLLPSLPALPALPDLSNMKLNSATGHAESTGSTGAWKLDDGDCYAGDDDGYFGIRVKSRADKRVYLKFVKDPLKGWNLAVSIPDTCKATSSGQECTLTLFDREACSTFDVDLKSYTFRGKYSRGGHQFDGTVTFDCKAHDGGHVSGKLTIEKCS